MMHTDAAAVAAKAWDSTKAKDDRDYTACVTDHQLKLATLVNDIDAHSEDPNYTTGVAGLEDFEEEVKKLLAAEAKKAEKAEAKAEKEAEKAHAAATPKALKGKGE